MIEGTNVKDYFKSIKNLTNKLTSINAKKEEIELISIYISFFIDFISIKDHLCPTLALTLLESLF